MNLYNLVRRGTVHAPEDPPTGGGAGAQQQAQEPPPTIEGEPVITPPPADGAQQQQAAAPTIDYDRIGTMIGEAVTRAVGAQGGGQQQQQQQQVQQPQDDPYAAATELLYTDPQAAIRATVDIATRNAVQAMMPYVQPAAQNFGMSQVNQGLDDVGQKYVADFIKEHNVDTALLADPIVADLLRTKGELHSLKSRGAGQQQPIPNTYNVGGYGVSNIDPESARELAGMEKMYKALGVQFDPARILGRLK